jgi:hypothetical protein
VKLQAVAVEVLEEDGIEPTNAVVPTVDRVLNPFGSRIPDEVGRVERQRGLDAAAGIRPERTADDLRVLV